MRPLELIVEGFTSFRTRQVLDFSSLDLFAITGATGAGKTSILDAITFALYDKVAQKSNSSRELVSQGATQLKVEFRFEMRQTEYRALRTWRNRGKTDEKKFLLDKLVDGEWERCDRTQNLEEIIGMNFETFTRVIVLPQGQFDEFLKGEASKRREILRQLAGFQIFEQMRKEASDRTSRFKAEREGLEKVLEGMQAPTLQEVQTQEIELINLKVEIPQLDTQAKQMYHLWESEERLFTQIQQQQKLSQSLSELQHQSTQIQSLEEQLHNAQVANSLLGSWTVLQTTRQRAQSAIADLTHSNQQLNSARQDLHQQQQAFEQFRLEQTAAQEHITTQERNLALAESLHIQQQQSQSELAIAINNVLERSQALDKLNKSQAQTDLERQSLAQQLQSITEAIASSRHDADKLSKLRQIAEPLTQWQFLQDNCTKQQQKFDRLQTDIQKLTQQLAKSQQAIAKAEGEAQKANLAFQQAESTNLKSLQSSHVNALRAELHDGDNCPVCNHFYNSQNLPDLKLIELIDTTNLAQQRELATDQLAKLQQEQAKIAANLETSQQQSQILMQEITALENQVSQLQEQIDLVISAPWQAMDLLSDRQELEKQAIEYQQLEISQSELTISVKNLESRVQSLTESQQLAELELTKATQARSHRQSQLSEISQRLSEITGSQSYQDLQQSILQAKTELSDRAQVIESAYQQAREIFAKREEAALKSQSNHDLAIIEQATQEANWQQELTALSFTEADFLNFQTTRSQMESWQQQIDSYQRQVQDLTTRLQIVTEVIAEQYTDEQAIAQLREQSQQAEQALQQASERRAAIKAWLEQATQKRQESQQIEERKLSLQAQEQTYHTLAQDLKSDKFQEYILDSLQKELAHRASVLLQQLSEQRYILQIEGGDYWVADNWNGGEKRRVRTLSGGETFAASLSMALALSERLSTGIELGSLFLDEGFGTLDSETLESVTQILESLRQQDRLIGVITHIQALAERLPTQIHVRKSINGSELVRI